MNTELFDIKIRAVEGGVTAAAGFKAAGIHAGFRKNPERLDYALVVPDKPLSAPPRLARLTCTGAAQKRLVVNTPAPGQGLSGTTSA